MPGISIYTGNRLEVLAGAFGDLLRRPLDSPLAQEVVMVQSRGMERWLRMQLARTHGISANIWFPFPNHFLETIFSKFFPDRCGIEHFSPAVLTWRIIEAVSARPEEPAFQSLQDYLKGGDIDLKRFQLSALIADTFDQYLLFRPDLIFGWENGEDTHWQARLWRILSSGHETQHRAALARDFLSGLERLDAPPGAFPQRLSVFGISVLPRFHMELLAGIATAIDVHLFLMNPCMEYWGDLVSERTMLAEARRVAEAGASGTDLYTETGNPLLSSLGALGRDFFDSVGEFPHRLWEHFEEPGTDSLLHCVQSDILHMFNRKASGDRLHVDPGDRSIQIHSCHSPMREIEVLHDVLLDLLERSPDLACEDMVVMTPDIDVYAPFIRSVFEKAPGDPAAIPFSIADRSLRSESAVAGTFLKVMDLCGGRYTASAVAEILESDPVAAMFGIHGEDLNTVKRWIRETRICWGIDADGRSEAGLPAFEENTWRAGISRLLLGYALPGGDDRAFQNIAPCDSVEGRDAEVLGDLCTFLKRLFEHTASLGAPRAPAQWARDLEDLLDKVFSASEPFIRDLQLLREALRDLGAAAGAAGFSGTIGLATVRWLLAGKLEKAEHGSGFIARGVTFCAMLPMRSIPFKVVCIVGLNGDAYPRRTSPPGFDLISRRPRKGDRSRRADDRYLFLEALLSARDVFCLSHVGRSIRDNTTIPPSVVTSELLDYISQGFTGETAVEEQVTRIHPLQPFSPDYFRPGGKLFSYSTESLEAAEAASGPRRRPAPFVSGRLPPPEIDRRPVRLEDLCAFFSHPARFFLKNRIGIFLDDPTPALEEREPFTLDGLDRYLLENRILSRLLSGRALSALFDSVRSEGLLPHGNIGRRLFDETAARVEDFARRLRPLADKPAPAPAKIALQISGFELTGSIDGLTTDGALMYRYARIGPGDKIRAWIKHLALCIASPPGVRRVSILAGLPERAASGKPCSVLYFREPASPVDLLARLLELYLEGSCRPLPFSPVTSWTYISARAGGQPENVARQRARVSWEGSTRSRGESEGPYNDLCFRETGLVDLPEFTSVATEIFGPLISEMEEPE